MDESLKQELRNMGFNLDNALEMQGMLYDIYNPSGSAIAVFEANGYEHVKCRKKDPTVCHLFNAKKGIQANIITGQKQYIGMYYTDKPKV